MKSLYNKYVRSIVRFTAGCLLTGVMSVAQAAGFPVYEDLPLPRPDNLPQFEAGDFKINPQRLDLYPNGFMSGDKQVLQKLCDYLLNDSDGRSIWESQAKSAAKILNQWDLNPYNFNRYVYRIPQLQALSLTWLLTGHKELGEFIRGHILQIAGLPFEFWVHAELRGYNSKKPVGGLETASLCTTLGIVLSATPGLFSAEEKAMIEGVLNEKGLIPCLNWLAVNQQRTNNWVAVLATGAYISAKYLNRPEAVSTATGRINGYVNGSVEADGSYGEGLGYFSYPVQTLLPAVLAMTPAEKETFLTTSGSLRHSASWRVYPNLFPSKASKFNSLHFGDNSYGASFDSSVTTMLACIYRDPVALWLKNKYRTSYSLNELLLMFSTASGMPEPLSPKEAGLPLVKCFAAGDSYIRSTWDSDGIVLGMWSGNGSQVKYSHQRPEMGSICLGAYGEYMIVSAGAASYRAKLRYEWDLAYRAMNTISIDDKNQLFNQGGIAVTADGAYRGGNGADVSGYWSFGRPVAEMLQCRSGEMADLLVNEMALSYHVPMKEVRRSVLFVRDPGYFVMVDRIESNGSSHKYSWRIHLNNKDGAGSIEEKGAGHWLFKRPSAKLDVYLYSDRALATGIGRGYLHGPGRDYSPGGKFEGKPGSSIEIEAHNPENCQSLVYYSVIYPTKKKTRALAVKYAAGSITVGSDTITFSEGECTIVRGDKTEKYKLQ
ncbi:MAG: heparinase II/III-family protein [Dysgonamonadaceae bacterium]|jgi:hypothetical protein|nr:heparinase II/III-family protein [Dysgonamonadaceae bacterium]